MYEKRFYREYMKPNDFINFTVIEQESDLHISAKCNLDKEAKQYLLKYREEIKDYASLHKDFYTSLIPLESSKNATELIKHMIQASSFAKVGPMATVAGAISQYVGLSLLQYTDEIIIENGGDIFIKTTHKKKILVYAGNSPFSNKIALSISPEDTPLGICTSAGKVGHSLSFGRADAIVVLSKDTLLADGVATAIGNMIVTSEDIHKGIAYGKSIEGIEGLLIIIDDKMGTWGNITFVQP
ncbi:UPF0280 family protein [Marinisporobacter balticus]|uniref:Thiamine biosynthesis protein ApbE n=1 Tax=Marinisporobacter balticus TaxID=2018667 RepID=A0A4R2KS06_9FIRM|nr:UPF0280 family protein [Marinisporobacter balticus]TCO73786.1 hypothetical protein EV214_11418 [Marinisporobacter balticus]